MEGAQGSGEARGQITNGLNSSVSPFSTAGYERKAMQYVVNVHVPGVAGAIASLLGDPARLARLDPGRRCAGVREVGVGALPRWPDLADRAG